MNISLVALSAARVYGLTPLFSYPLKNTPALINMRNLRVVNLFTAFFQSQSAAVGLSIENSHFEKLLSSVVDVNSYHKCGTVVRDPTTFPELVFLKITNCQFLDIESFDEDSVFSFYASTGNTIISSSLFAHCKSHGSGKVVDVSTTQFGFERNCFDECLALNTHTSLSFDSHAYGRVSVESVSIKGVRVSEKSAIKMYTAVYGDYQKINNYNNSGNSIPNACMGLSTTYACNSDFTFCIFNDVQSISFVIANNFKKTDRLSYFNFVNCTGGVKKSSLMTVYKGNSVDVNYWAFSDVSVDYVVVSVETNSVVISNCNFWFEKDQEDAYFKGGNCVIRDSRYNVIDATMIPFVIPIDEKQCMYAKCEKSAFWPSEEIVNDVVVTVICAIAVIAGVATRVVLPQKAAPGEDTLL